MEAANLANLAALVLRIELLSAANYVRARHQTTCMDTSTDDVYQMRADGVHYSKRHAWARRQTKCTKCEQTMFTMSYQTTPLAEPFLLVVADEKKKPRQCQNKDENRAAKLFLFLSQSLAISYHFFYNSLKLPTFSFSAQATPMFRGNFSMNVGWKRLVEVIQSTCLIFFFLQSRCLDGNISWNAFLLFLLHARHPRQGNSVDHFQYILFSL